MRRRQFFKKAGLFGLGSMLINPLDAISRSSSQKTKFKNTPKNIIFLVSDGMSIGTLNMANLLSQRKYGKDTNWISLYKQNKVIRSLMDMASASSIVTDSAAASSSWGAGYRINNGGLNYGVNGELYTPIWKKFKNSGKKAGCVTTVPITHATPAGFLTNSKTRKDQAGIAQKYLNETYDVLMGGGHEFFDKIEREDHKDLYDEFIKKGYDVVKDKKSMIKVSGRKPILGVFSKSALPYAIDRVNTNSLKDKIPNLSEMTKVAIDAMKSHSKGFVLQVEAGKVDWAAHANCSSGLLYDQLDFDKAIKEALDFADSNQETLVVITTDHGNANPGLLYGKDTDKKFDNLMNFKYTNEWILNNITSDSNVSQIVELINHANGFAISKEDAYNILGYYNGLEKGDDGLYNYKHLPYTHLAEIQKKHTNIGWIGNNHSADYVELAMYGAGSQNLQSFIKNTDLHWYLLDVTGVKY